MTGGVLGITLLILLSWVALPRWRGTPASGELTRFTVTSPEPGGITRLTVSPNGRKPGVCGGRAHSRALVRFVRGARPRRHRRGGTPFWSPDSRYLAFASAGKLKLIDHAGGPTRILTEVNTNLGGSWSDDGTILIGMVGDGLYRVAAAGGPLTRVDGTRSGA